MNNLRPVSIALLNQLPRINDVRFSPDGRSIVYSAADGSRGVLYIRAWDAKPFEISGGLNVQGGIGYGGGEFSLCSNTVVFSEKSGCLYRAKILSRSLPDRISPAWGASGAPELSPDGKWVLYVFQDGSTDGLAVVRTFGSSWPMQLVMGADFYMQPCWHPSGKRIAWAEWNHPHMPWEASHIKLGEVGGMQIKLLEERQIAGGLGISASQPLFSPDGRWLSYIIRDGNWDSLILYHLKKCTHKVLVLGEGFHLRLPEWVQGMRSYAWSHDSSRIFYIRYAHGKSTLWKVNISNRKSLPVDTGEIQWLTQLDSSPVNDDLIFLGSSPRIPKTLCLIKEEKLLMKQTSLEKALGKGMVQPVEISFQTKNGESAFAFLFRSVEKNQQSGALIIQVHGGPTASSPLSFSGDAAWFTSRGFAYAQLNYRGSSGYGYDYQEALRHQWGIVDVEDAHFLANHLIEKGLADPKRIVIMGSSAGGYTVLRSLITYPGFYKAGICSYGVSDLLADANNTHKFEKYYHCFLTGDLVRNRSRFIDRSPIHHIEQIKDPVALFHGDADPVVAVNQTLEIYEKLNGIGTPCTLRVYPGEGHGFREPDNINDYFNRIEEFLNMYLK